MKMVSPRYHMSLELKRFEARRQICFRTAVGYASWQDKMCWRSRRVWRTSSSQVSSIQAVGINRTAVQMSRDVDCRRGIVAYCGKFLADFSSEEYDPDATCVVQCFWLRKSIGWLFRKLTQYGRVECTLCHRDELKKALELDLIDKTPFELIFLEALGNAHAFNVLVTAFADPTIGLQGPLSSTCKDYHPTCYSCL